MEEFNNLTRVIARLRDPKTGCPWDREQTLDSLQEYILEETHELLEAIQKKKPESIREELGDLLLQIVLVAQINREKGIFNIRDVINDLVKKLVNRHPHIFGNQEVRDSKQVKSNWEKIKLKEKSQKSILSDYPKNMPALMVAKRITEQASSVGFDWKNAKLAWQKVEEEIDEFQKEIETGDFNKLVDEMGDLLFALTNVARLLKINPEFALRRANDKFKQRFRFMETAIKQSRGNIEEMTLPELDQLWNRAKTEGE